MKKFAMVTSIAGIVCIVLGVVVITAASVAGASFPRIMRNQMIHYHNGRGQGYGSGDWEGAEECSFDGITELDAEVRKGSLFIREGDTDRMNVRIADSYGRAFCRQDGNRLEIDAGEDGGRAIMDGKAKGFLDGFRSNQHDRECQVEITVPAGYRFESVDLDLGAGYVEADALRADEINLDAGAGYGEISSLEADRMRADVGVGYLNIDQADVASLLEADCGVGSLEMDILGSLEDFSYEVDCSMGTVILDGESYSGPFQNGNEDLGFPAGTGTKMMKLNCGVGSMDISFEE